jgi:hypothetical protein
MRVFVQSTLPCEAELAWNEVQTSRVLREICRPLIALRPARGETSIPERWQLAETVRLRPLLFGVIPLGTRSLHWESIDQVRREMQTREHDPLVRRWDHRIHVEPLAGDACRYTDEVHIDAGVLTLPVWLFAQWFYRHRQRRWRRVARRLQGAAT